MQNRRINERAQVGSNENQSVKSNTGTWIMGLAGALLGGALGSIASAQEQGPGLVSAAPLASEVSTIDRGVFTIGAVQRWGRVDAFRSAWEDASSESRARVVEVMGSLRSAGAPSEWWPDLGSIEVGTRILNGLDDAAFLAENKAGALAVQAASLDLRVLPGAFEARSEGRTASLVVRVSPLFELREALEVKVSLIWVGPDGAEITARTEVISARAFSAPGFDMYLRAPHTRPGVWQLVAELTPMEEASLEERKQAQVVAELAGPVRSHPTFVPALADPVAELARERGLLATLQSGATGLSPSEQAERSRPVFALEHLLSDGLRLSPDRAVPFEDYWRGRAGSAAENWTARRELRTAKGVGGQRGAFDFLRVTPSSQIGGDLQSGTSGAKWGILGEIHDVDPSRDGIDPTIANALDELHSADWNASLEGEARPDRVLILRGDSLMATQMEALRNGPAPLEYLVIVANSWRPTPLFKTVPTLFLTTSEAAASIAGAASHVTTRVLPYSVFLSDLYVPRLIAEWLGERAAEVAEDAGK